MKVRTKFVIFVQLKLNIKKWEVKIRGSLWNQPLVNLLHASNNLLFTLVYAFSIGGIFALGFITLIFAILTITMFVAHHWINWTVLSESHEI